MRVTQAAVADHLFLTRGTVSKMITAGTLPKSGTLDEYRKFYIENLRNVAAGYQSQDGQLDLTAERARLAKEQADRLARENQVAKGELLKADEIVECWGQQCHRIRNKLLAAGVKLAPLMPGVRTPAEAKVAIDAVIHEALHELSMPE